ncbi:hypothetical protein [Pseudomonas syringae]|uniref:hypothetical protein n=1 Tax=Pseudomonas syringae TaxID=317 RepID=UPI00147D7806|nr:hypothetical protein [Pseudomonas syringae]
MLAKNDNAIGLAHRGVCSNGPLDLQEPSLLAMNDDACIWATEAFAATGHDG